MINHNHNRVPTKCLGCLVTLLFSVSFCKAHWTILLHSNILCHSTVLSLHAMYAVLLCTYVGSNGSIVYLEEVPLQALPMFQGTCSGSVCSSSVVVNIIYYIVRFGLGMQPFCKIYSHYWKSGYVSLWLFVSAGLGIFTAVFCDFPTCTIYTLRPC